jgi:hypothetical protein
MLAVLLIIPTLAFIPVQFYILPAVYLATIRRSRFLTSEGSRFIYGVDKNLLIIFLLIIFTALNKWFHLEEDYTLGNLYPYTLATLITYFIAKNLQKKDLKLLVVLVVAEGVVVCFQYFMGVNTFFDSLNHFNENISKNPDVLYNRRALGLSENSSVIAYKFFLAYIIMDYYRMKNMLHTLFRIILIAGIFFTFNRTVFLVAFVYILLSLIKLYGPIIENILDRKIKVSQIKYLILGITGLMLLFILSAFYIDEIFAQLTRGKSNGVDLSGRGHIWEGFIHFIKENPWWGNAGEKFYVEHRGKDAHGHNSFLQVIATHGLLIFTIYLWLVLRNINRKNFLFVSLIFVYSMFQYGVFWGTSLMDIIFFKFLFFLDNDMDSRAHKIS